MNGRSTDRPAGPPTLAAPPPAGPPPVPPAPGPVVAPLVERREPAAVAPAGTVAAEPRPAATDTGTPAGSLGQLVDGGFAAKLGTGLLLRAQDFVGGRVDLSDAPQPLPGVRLRSARLGESSLAVTGDLTVPILEAGEVRIRVDRTGTPRISGSASKRIAVPALGSPLLTLSLDESGGLAGAVEFQELQRGFSSGPLRGLTVVGSGRVAIAGGRLSGNGEATLTYADVGSAVVNFHFDEAGQFAGGGQLHLAAPFLTPVDAVIGVDEERNLTASVDVDLARTGSPLPGVTLTGGRMLLTYDNGRPSARLNGFTAAYQQLGSLTIADLRLERASFTGQGSFVLAVPTLRPVTGSVRISQNRVSGSLRIEAKDFPAGLPVRSGAIGVSLREDGTIGFTGRVRVELGPAGRGELEAAYDAGQLSLGAAVTLTVPGLRPIPVAVTYANGALSARAEVPIDSDRLPGLSGTVTVQYTDGLWSGGTTLGYTADSGKLSGTITVTVAQNETGSLEVGGSGAVTAQLMPSVSGTLTATILPEGGIDVSGSIVVTEPVELFPEKRLEKELFRLSKNIPLWGIVVAVIRVSAGVRAGIGKGVFRNITVTGSYTIGSAQADPSFSVSGELYIPAFVEGYVSFGAGLGVDVVLGSLTGGIEGVATAGLYGAISVVPELSYEGGEWGIQGVATLAAGARLTLGLNAWAEVEAMWVTVWDDEWHLAEMVTPIGPDLALQARLNYRFGRPDPPELEFTSSDVDADALIKGAMPDDGPPASGAREALENKAQWQGALREQRNPPVPPALAAEAQTPAAAPPAPARPPKREAPTAPPGHAAPVESDPGSSPTPGNEPARSQAVDAAAQTDTSIPPSVPPDQLPPQAGPRYPGPITLTTLDEPPAPMPRTREQEEQDVDAAASAVQAASAQSTDSDTLDNYFPRIKQRFGLASLGYQGDFARGFQVLAEINPERLVAVKEPLKGTGIPGDGKPGHTTEVKFWTTGLTGAGAPFPVGAKMVAAPLGPDHPLGTAPSQQEELMAMLPGDYIRGHLLNEQLGGPGEIRNLYPITRSANATHASQIERYVKKWVNEDRYWVRYSVEVTGSNTLQRRGERRYVDASLDVSASVLNTDLTPMRGVQTTITSAFEQRAEVSTEIDESTIRKVEEEFPEDLARRIDRRVDVQVAADGPRPAVLPVEIRDAIREAIAAHGGAQPGRDWVSDRLQRFPGVGPGRAGVLIQAYDEVRQRTDTTVTTLSPSEKGDLTFVIGIWRDGLGRELKKP